MSPVNEYTITIFKDYLDIKGYQYLLTISFERLMDEFGNDMNIKIIDKELMDNLMYYFDQATLLDNIFRII